MGPKPSEETANIQAENVNAFKAWISKHGKMVMPVPGKSVIYAGVPEGHLRQIKKGLMSASELQGMWKIIEKTEKQIREFTGYVEYDMLSDVLKRLKTYPKLREATGANIGDPKRYANMYDCAAAMASDDWQLMPRGMRTAVWQALSKLYVQNSKGEIQIWEGRKDNYKKIDRGCILINTELKAVLKNKDLSKDTRKKAEEMSKRYRDFHAQQNKKLDQLFQTAKKNLAAGAKG